MKALIAIATLFVAVSANAKPVYVLGSVLFQSASTYVPGAKVCRDGDVLRHKTKDAVAVEYCEGDSQSKCEVVYKKLEQPVVATAKRCAAFAGRDDKHCTRWETYAFDQSTVRVTKYVSESQAAKGNGGQYVGRTAIPACR